MSVRTASRSIVFAAAAVAALLAWSPTALAWDENSTYPLNPPVLGGAGHQPCRSCHGFRYENPIEQAECVYCHGATGSGAGNGKGPHGNYLAATNRCASCHSVHTATGGWKLLPGNTVTDSCFACHDGTGGNGVYGAIAARGASVSASHSIDVVDGTGVIPGGDGATGGDRTQAFVGQSSYLGCNDCHSPHDSQTVTAFPGDRQRTTVYWMEHSEQSNKLLRQRPTGATTATAEYGSDWCLGCHRGRVSGGAVHNHPVDSLAVTGTPFVYRRAAIITTDAPSGATTLGPVGGWNRTPHTSFMHGNESPDDYGLNRGFLMPFPRTPEQSGHYPICQQCHEDTRYVGTLSANGLTADPATFTLTSEDGSSTADNPRFQNFPHETQNTRLLVETNDDLCTNCHPPAVLP